VSQYVAGWNAAVVFTETFELVPRHRPASDGAPTEAHIAKDANPGRVVDKENGAQQCGEESEHEERRPGSAGLTHIRHAKDDEHHASDGAEAEQRCVSSGIAHATASRRFAFHA